MWNQFRRSNFFIRLFSWEYWPFGIVQFPVIVYWLFLVLKNRSFLFFSASNPGIDMGGMFGESKFDVLKKIPEKYIPKTILIEKNSTTNEVIDQLSRSGFTLPVIFKPDIGERGHMVKKISNRADIEDYLLNIRCDFLAQELVELPLEFGVFYVRFPDEKFGAVTSVVGKEMLTITGNGKQTIQELILSNDRARLQWEKLKVKFASSLNNVLPAREQVELVSIGNHALGTKFLDCNHLINERLSKTFDDISKNIDGFYFGRYDLRCASIEDLYNGRIQILELNGCGAEPAHIYQPGFSLMKAVGVLLKHWWTIDKIANQNKKRGIDYISFAEAKRFYKKFKDATRG
jgi:hypothetical protein